jgi:hypothetical protein
MSEEEFRIYGLTPAAASPAYADLLARCIHPEDRARLDTAFRNCPETQKHLFEPFFTTKAQGAGSFYGDAPDQRRSPGSGLVGVQL